MAGVAELRTYIQEFAKLASASKVTRTEVAELITLLSSFTKAPDISQKGAYLFDPGQAERETSRVKELLDVSRQLGAPWDDLVRKTQEVLVNLGVIGAEAQKIGASGMGATGPSQIQSILSATAIQQGPANLFASAEKLEGYVQKFVKLASSSKITRVEVGQLTEALRQLVAIQVAAPGAGVPAFGPTKELLVITDQLLEVFKQLGGPWVDLIDKIRQAMAEMNRVQGAMAKSQIGLGAQRPIPEPAPPKQYVATVAGRPDVATALLDEETLVKSLEAAYTSILGKYSNVDASLQNTTQHLNRANAEWIIQTEVVEKTGTQLTLLGKEYAKASAATGELIKQPTTQEILEERLGTPRKIEQFNKTLARMKMTMSDLRSGTIEAGSEMGNFIFRTEEGAGVTRSATFHIDRLGRITTSTSNKFKGFGNAIAANIQKVMRWTIAVGLVYGGMRQMRDMFGFMRELQTYMADITIVLGDNTKEIGTYFDEIAKIADIVGVDVADTMKASVDALKAAGGLEEGARVGVAFELLEDAASLATLGNIEMQQSIDLLVSSLTQLKGSLGDVSEPLTAGDILLEKWVAVSKIAKVSVNDLAQGFATVAADADAVGVSIDQLNAMLATMATVTNLSSQQTANAFRAISAAIASPSTQGVLERYGFAIHEVDIATGELTGNLRDLPDILEEVSVAYEAGILGEKELGEIGGALGGQGARRRAQIVAFLKEYNQVLRITTASEEAEGNLQEALALKAATLDKAIVRLQNSFKALGETLGGDGGFLDLFTGIVDGTTVMIKGIKALVAALGPATAAVTAYMAAWALGRQFALQERLTRGMAGVGGMHPALQAMAGPGGGRGGQVGTGLAYGATAGLMTGLASKSAAQGIGAMIGTSFGYIASGNAIGGAIGSIIGTFFGRAVEEGIPIWRANMGLEAAPAAAGMERGAILEELSARLFGPGGGDIGKMVAKLRTPEAGEEEILLAAFERRLGARPSERAAISEVSEARIRELIQALDELTRATEFKAEFEYGGAGPYQERVLQYQAEYTPGLEAKMRERRMELPLEFTRGDITSARDFNAAVERTYDIITTINPVVYAMETALKTTGSASKDVGAMYLDMGTDMAEWSDEAINFILGQANALNLLYANVIKTGEGYEALGNKTQQFIQLYEGMRREQLRQTLTIPGFTDLSDLTAREFEEIRQQAANLQQQFAQELEIPDEAFESIERWAVLVDSTFQWEGSVMQQFFNMAKQEADEAGSAMEESFNVRRLKDVDPGKMGEIAQKNRYWMEYMARLKGQTAQQYMEMEGQQFNLILGPGNVLQQLYSTNEAMNFTLQDILEVEEKQLEGMWNIPSGATFWVPLTSLFYQGAGEGAYPELPELLPPTERTAENTAETASNVRDVTVAIWESAAGQERYYKKMTDLFALDVMEAMEVTPKRGVPTELEDMPEGITELAKLMADIPYETVTPTDHEAWKEGLDTSIAAMTSHEQRRLESTERIMGVMAPEEAPTDFWGFIKEALGVFGESGVMRGIGGGAGMMAPVEIPAPPPAEVTVNIPDIKSDIFATFTLDGRVIAQYVTEIIERQFSRTYKSRGSSTTGQIQ